MSDNILRAALERAEKVLGSLSVMEAHSGNTTRREWGNGIWLYPEDAVFHGSETEVNEALTAIRAALEVPDA